MTWRSRLRVVRRGATLFNGFWLFMTIVFAVIVAGEVHDEDVVWYVLLATIWTLSVYWHGFELLGRVMELQEELAEPHESLQAIRQRAEAFPITGMVPFMAAMGLT